MEQILDLLNCPISGRGTANCDDWLRDWLMRKYLDHKCVEEGEATVIFRSFFDHLETKELILFVFAGIFVHLENEKKDQGREEREIDYPLQISHIDEMLREMISSCSQSTRCSLFPSDVLKLAAAIQQNDTSKLQIRREVKEGALDLEGEAEVEESSCKYSLKSYGNDIKEHSKKISQLAMSFGHTFKDKIRPWLSKGKSFIFIYNLLMDI